MRILECVMQADRHRHYEEEDEGDARHRITEDPAADGAWDDHVIGDIGRDQPEIDDRVQRP